MKQKIYLSCPYEFQDKEQNWKQIVRYINKDQYDLFDPCPDPLEKAQVMQLKLNNQWGQVETIAKDIVRRDLEDLKNCDGCLVYLPPKIPTVGTIHEIIYCVEHNKPIVLVAPQGLVELGSWIIGLLGLKNIALSVKDGFGLLQQKLEPKQTKFIAFSGKKQVGKSTSANLLKKSLEKNGLEVKVVSFADSLKQACSTIFNISLEDMETEEGKRKLTNIPWPQDESLYSGVGWREQSTLRAKQDTHYMTVREILQFVGSDLFRTQMLASVWTDAVFNKKYPGIDTVIIPDARFPNEIQATLNHQGYVYRVNRETGLKDSHMSETALDDFCDDDFTGVIVNNSTLDRLGAEIELISKYILAEHQE